MANNEKEKIRLIRELEILRELDHPNVIKFFEVFHNDKQIHLVMEYCEGNCIFIFLNKKIYRRRFGKIY
jgi:serine/threonine protein kinase